MTRQLSSLDDIDRYEDDDNGDDEHTPLRKGMTKSQVNRAQKKSNKKPSKSEMPLPLRPKKSKPKKSK